MSETGYNGWRNYETWAANLWLTNDEEAYREACRAARRGYEALRDYLYDVAGVEQLGASFASDLVTSALSEIDIIELIESLIGDESEEEGGVGDDDAE